MDNAKNMDDLDREQMIDDLWHHEQHHMTVMELLLTAQGVFYGIYDNLSHDEVFDKCNKVFGEGSE